MTDRGSYYGRPIVKETPWKPEIPLYFFFGGLAGASAALAEGARLAGNPVLASRARVGAVIGAGVSPVLLVKDLGRPKRFHHMLRVFKVRSPMSVGTWILSAFGTCVGGAFAADLLGVLPRTRRAAEAAAGILGLPMSSYTGALVSDSVVPAWHEGRHELPLSFAASAAAAAGGAASILTPAQASRPARRLAVLGALTEVVATKVMAKRLVEPVSDAYEQGTGGAYARAASAAGIAGAGLMTLAGRRRGGAVAAGALLVAGSLCHRLSVYHAGKASALDPHHTSIPQRERARQESRRASSGSSRPASTR